MTADGTGWQRLDLWLWCARVARARADCARLVSLGGARINRQPTEKAHARLRVGDVLTVAHHGSVRVLRVLALASRRGPASEARLLYEEVAEDEGADPAQPCAPGETSSYPPAPGPAGESA